MSGGDKVFEQELLQILKLEFPKELKELKLNFKAKNFEKVTLDIHKIKHKIGLLGMADSLEFASKVEYDIKKGITEEYDDLLLILDRIAVYLSHKQLTLL
ncbi:Hpt domain-containing protein [uncultured Polaribacter sp.]|uniref:Hpt domain-containing protein n=1 Tax=uncultured Polaribacter sp. TaxID=174711 RepID=UPI00261AE69F|nr:Hpt domain-containing protein [uncultured Polaribacter sp.]